MPSPSTGLTPELLQHSTSAEREALEAELRRQYALVSPLSYAETVSPWMERYPYLELLDRLIVEVCEGRLINDLTGKPYQKMLVSLPPQHGKALQSSTPVLTDSGWKTHGALTPGDRVFSPSGRLVRVKAVAFTIADCDVLVRTTDDSAVYAHANHEWTVFDRSKHKWLTVETKDLVGQDGQGRSTRCRFQLPHQDALQLPEASLPIDPYFLGVWLGDGTSTDALVCGAEADLDFILKKLPTPSRTYFHTVTGVKYARWASKTGVSRRLWDLGLRNNKHIPVQYQMSSEPQRRALLSGLVDTDGHVDATGRCVFVGVNERLVRDVGDLVQSLGYRPTIQCRKTPIRAVERAIKDIHPVWEIAWTPHDGLGQGTLPRKVKPRFFKPRLIGVQSVTQVEPQEGQCIQVDSEDGLYLAGRGLVPTHNSSLISEHTPPWYLHRWPDKRVGVISYESDFAKSWGRKARGHVKEHPELGLKLDPDAQAADAWELLGTRGGMVTGGIGGALTGKPIDLLVIDDPVKNAEEARSKTARDNAWDWFQSVATTRIQRGGVIIILMTRWNEDDLGGRAMTHNRQDWFYVNLPAIAGDDDILGRSPGQALCPERFNEEELSDKRAGMSAYWWNALYQGAPSTEGDGIFRAPFRYWSYASPRGTQQPTHVVLHPPEGGGGVPEYHDRKGLIRFQTIDLAITTKETSDYSVVSTWDVTRSRELLLVDRIRVRMEGPDHRNTVINAFRAFHPKWIAVEKNVYGISLVQELRRIGLPVRELIAKGDKIGRAVPAGDYCASGKVFFPKGAPWLDEWEHELLMFPNGTHDDQVDTLTYAVQTVTTGVLSFVARDPEKDDLTLRGRLDKYTDQMMKRKVRRRKSPGSPMGSHF